MLLISVRENDAYLIDASCAYYVDTVERASLLLCSLRFQDNINNSLNRFAIIWSIEARNVFKQLKRLGS